ncbi:hypothetical protein L2E82_53328 [Cichorium intybus]|nr:hypothetical protein L2E82_53328 [Cichorium intybus]
MFSLIKNESWGLEDDQIPSYVSTINDADQGSADVAFRTPLAPYEKSKFLGSGGSMVARLKLKGIDEGHHQEWSLRLNLTQHGETYQIIAIVGLQRGIPSKRESSARVDYVPALCTHRPSLLPIEWSGEVLGSRRRGRFARRRRRENSTEPYHLEKEKS